MFRIGTTSFKTFLKKVDEGKYQGLTLGQAFINHFAIHNGLISQKRIDVLKRVDGARGELFIRRRFNITRHNVTTRPGPQERARIKNVLQRP